MGHRPLTGFVFLTTMKVRVAPGKINFSKDAGTDLNFKFYLIDSRNSLRYWNSQYEVLYQSSSSRAAGESIRDASVPKTPH